MSENGHGSSAQKRFSGDGNFGAAEHKSVETMGLCSPRCQESWWNASRGSGPLDIHFSGWSGCIGTGIDITDTCTEGGEELVFRELDQRFPDKVAADHMGEAMEGVSGMKIMKNETTEAFTGRSRLVFTRLREFAVGSPRVHIVAWMSTWEPGLSNDHVCNPKELGVTLMCAC